MVPSSAYTSAKTLVTTNKLLSQSLCHSFLRRVLWLDQCHLEAEEIELALMGFLLLSVWKMLAWGAVPIMAIGGVMIGP